MYPGYSGSMSSNRHHVAVVVRRLWFAPGTGTGSICWDSGPINRQIPVLPPTPGTVGGEVVIQIDHRDQQSQTKSRQAVNR